MTLKTLTTEAMTAFRAALAVLIYRGRVRFPLNMQEVHRDLTWATLRFRSLEVLRTCRKHRLVPRRSLLRMSLLRMSLLRMSLLRMSHRLINNR